MTKKVQIVHKAWVLLIVMIFATTGFADVEQRTVFEPVHWAYSSFFGTGWYKVKDARSVFVVRAPIRQILRKSALAESGAREVGIEVRYPVSIGMHDINSLGGIIQDDNFATVSFAPGIELEIPINQRWYLRSLVHAGWGTDLKSEDSAWIYYTGIKSRYSFPGQKYQWSLLNSLFYAGYAPDEGRSDHLAVAQVGVELLQPLDNTTLFGEPVDLHWTFMYSFLGHELHFNLPDGTFDPIQDQIELGLQVSLRNRPFRFWFIELQRLGLGYQFSSSGEITAITFSARSWFTK